MHFSKLKLVYTFLSVFVIAWLIGFFYFRSTLPIWEEDDKPSKTDAIVVLTGVSNRITVGSNLLIAGLANRLLITGVNPDQTLKSLMYSKCFGELSSAQKDCIEAKTDLGYTAHDTVGNAIETKVWLQGKNIHTIRLVTSDYHMYRSLLVFHDVLPHVVIIPHPVNSGEFSWALVLKQFREYNKYIVFWGRITLQPFWL